MKNLTYGVGLFVVYCDYQESNHPERTKSCHREIYLNNANRAERSKRKTILRYEVE